MEGKAMKKHRAHSCTETYRYANTLASKAVALIAPI